MVEKENKNLDYLHFKQTDVCIVCATNTNNNELFLKFHP